MIRQEFNVKTFWKVIVYFDIDYNLVDIIEEDFQKNNIKKDIFTKVVNKLYARSAKAATINNYDRRMSIVLFNIHEDSNDYLNSIVHEAEHIKQAMLGYYSIEDTGESPAYTVGYLVSMMKQGCRKCICCK